MYLDLQFVDMTTCEPAKNIAIDFWSCNATVNNNHPICALRTNTKKGVYGATQTVSLGRGKDLSDMNNMMLRGTQLIDENGVVQFISNFPGHYTGRTNHVHRM
jgi:protocatechuate 3,4-dioxygenase beta subunit